MERDQADFQAGTKVRNFNSHAHVERDWNILTAEVKLEISTHTLTWSVTKDFAIDRRIEIISTHTLTWSVTTSVRKIYSSQGISTHTLTWSVTFISTYLPFFCHTISTHTLTWSVTC